MLYEGCGDHCERRSVRCASERSRRKDRDEPIVPNDRRILVPSRRIEGVFCSSTLLVTEFEGGIGDIRLSTTTSFFPITCKTGVSGFPSSYPLNPQPGVGPKAATRTAALTGFGGHSMLLAGSCGGADQIG